MSSTERAPEPTMEEILASIRRIIADDDSSPTQNNTASLAREEEARPGNIADVEADTRIIDDIARVLSGGAQPSAGEDDILDLTQEFGPAEPPMEVAAEPSLGPAPQDAAPQNASQSETYVSATIYAAGPEAGQGTGEMEPVSALEAAIAALKAGMAATSEPEPEPEFTLTEFEMEATASSPAPEPEPEEAEEAEQAEETPFWPPGNASWAKNGEALTNGEASHDSAPARTNGGSREPHYEQHYATSEFTGQTLQDSIKASLRPLLRQWIDAHMSRVLEDALRDELKGADENLSRMLTAALRDELKDAEAKLRSN